MYCRDILNLNKMKYFVIISPCIRIHLSAKYEF